MVNRSNGFNGANWSDKTNWPWAFFLEIMN